MNNEQQQIIDEAYENYEKEIIRQRQIQEEEVARLRSQFKRVRVSLIELLTQEEFINKCKTNPEFSEKWGLKIEERELSEGERGLLLQPLGLDPLTKEGRDRLWKENNLPTKVITITHKDKTIESYK